MTGRHVIDNMAHGWNRSPLRSAPARTPSGVSAALWTQDVIGETDLIADPVPDFHALSLRLSDNKAELSFNGKIAHGGLARTGSISFLRAGDTVRSVNIGKWRVLHVYIPTALVTDVAEDEVLTRAMGPADLQSAFDIGNPVMERCLREIMTEMHQDLPLTQARVDCLGQDLVIQLLRQRAPDRSRRDMTYPVSDWRLRRVIEWIDDQLSEDFGVADLARVAGLSSVHLTNLFRDATGMPPYKWIVRRRIERARDLLSHSDLSIVEIALRCGFSTSQHFATTFRNAVGTTPKEFRRTIRS